MLMCEHLLSHHVPPTPRQTFFCLLYVISNFFSFFLFLPPLFLVFLSSFCLLRLEIIKQWKGTAITKDLILTTLHVCVEKYISVLSWFCLVTTRNWLIFIAAVIVKWGIKRRNLHAVLTALDIASVLDVTEILDIVFLTLRHRQGFGVRQPSSYYATRRRQRIESTASICCTKRSECNETEQNVERQSFPCAWISTKMWEHTGAISLLRN